MGFVVEFEIGAAQYRPLGFGLARAPKHGVDARDELFDREGLYDVVVTSDGEPVDSIRRGVTGGEKQDRCAEAGFSKAPQDLESVEVGKHDVEDDEVEALVSCGGEGIATVGDGRRREPFEPKRRGNEERDVVLVVDDEDTSNSSPSFCHGFGHLAIVTERGHSVM